MNKWGKKLQKELDKYYSKEMQELINWYPDCEDFESYIWKFKLDINRPETHFWILSKYSNIITKKTR